MGGSAGRLARLAAGSWALGERQGAVQVAELQGRTGEAEAGGPGWLTKSTMKQTDVFVPFAF